MKVHRIENVDDALFSKTWEIYQYSFPHFEKRTIEHQNTAFENPDYHLDCYFEEDKYIGFIGYWVFSDYVYIEHYAIDSECRGGGYGTKILSQFIKEHGKLVVLEIDPPVDDVSKRRLRFYKHLGFVENPHSHKCHVYHFDHNYGDEDLDILTHPVPICCEFYSRFNDDLHNVVMKR